MDNPGVPADMTAAVVVQVMTFHQLAVGHDGQRRPPHNPKTEERYFIHENHYYFFCTNNLPKNVPYLTRLTEDS
jgi:hypothetical protein